MVRVFRRHASASARRAPSRTAKRNAQKHKVIMESITQEKKKLRSVISFETKAPPGYTFISAGNPQVTNACKELCRKDGLKIYAVTTTPHMRAHNLSQHVHRIGFHFPSAVVATVCMNLGLSLTAAGRVVPVHGVGGHIRSDSQELSQIEINTEARDALRDLFPNIPDNDLNQIIKTAFQKGQQKVGTALELPLARRAQLAVVAHIRHVYTNYDRLLKMTSFHEARSLVEESTLAKLVAWRGDDENGKTVLEDVFREVIVISDDDDDTESDEDENGPPSTKRDHSVEYVSSRARAVELPTKQIDFADPASRAPIRELSEDEAPSGFRVIPQVPKRNKVDRRGFSRYQAWDRAINRYRDFANATDTRLYGSSTDQQRPYSLQQPPHGVEVGTGSMDQPTSFVYTAVPPIHRVHSSLEHPSQGNPDIAQPTDIAPLRREPVLRDGHDPFRQFGLTDVPILNNPQGFHDGNKFRVGHQPRLLASSHTRNVDAQDRVLPSIENPSSPRRPVSGRLDGLREGIPRSLPIRSVTPQRLPHQNDLHNTSGDNSNGQQFPKRRRIAYYEPVNGNPRSGIAPGVVESVVSNVLTDTPTGPRYAPYEVAPENHSSREDLHLHRNFITPTGLSTTGCWPQHRGSPVHANPSFELRRVDGQKVYAAHSHSAEVSKGSYAIPSTPAHAVAVDDSHRRPVQISFDPKAPPFHLGNHDYSRSRLLEDSQLQAPTWRDRDDERFTDISNRRHLYADDFVRPVPYEPEPLEYTMQRPRVAETSHPSRVWVHDGEHRDGHIDTRAPVTYRDHRPLDHRAAPFHGYATFEDTHRPLGSDRVLGSSSQKQQYEESWNSARHVHSHSQYTPHAQIWERPTYVRRVERPEPPHPIPDNRPIVIVD
ncbi:DUF2293 domain-containing protein [Aspergillus chevalieri]|uniref:DUF2293 domain-containing protein n=1 Tax=Aspergillus chevalieri TaxID=182096 RepID=A0A7R7ZN00_ASPCH|nr:uncharacterized protein ACHE_30993S [Aspergillus chevalieri]BCR87006.1 hypothetical protein ACHE_30993S [Aspergillus chevalieri]